MIYTDKNKKVIVEGAMLQHDDGDIQVVYPCGDDDLGFSASNEEFMKKHPNEPKKYYPLSQFELSKWKIIGEPVDDNVTVTSFD